MAWQETLFVQYRDNGWLTMLCNRLYITVYNHAGEKNQSIGETGMPLSIVCVDALT